MGSRLDVSPFLLSANSSNRSSRDSRTEMAAVVAAHFAAFSCCFHLAPLARTGAERTPRFEWDV